MPRLLNASKLERRMRTDGEDAENSMFTILTNPSKTLANWYLWLGCLGLMLAILNLMNLIHPNYHISWGGLLTFELTNPAFGDKDTAATFVASDAIFIMGCLAMVAAGVRTLVGEETVGDWFSSMIKTDWYNDLIEPDNGGWALILGTWCIVASLGFYFYRGIIYMNWIDPGIYSIAIVLMATGLVLRMLSSVEDEE